MKILPVVKGLVTAAAMIGVIVLIYKLRDKAPNWVQYLVYIFYGLGITWTLLAHRYSPEFTGSFGNIFFNGFRCFIVVTLMMALFYGLFNYIHPEFAEETSKVYRTQLEEQVAKKEILPTDVEPQIATFKKQYILKLVSGAIFGYLIIGAGVTALGSALLTRRNS